MNLDNLKFLLRPRLVLVVYILLTIIVTITDIRQSTYNNYSIFSKPFFNLLAEKNLYLEYPNYYYDTYKYSPAFALFMGPFALLPDWIGLFAWNSLNSAVLYSAGCRLFQDTRYQALFLLLTISDMLTALHNSQANCLLLGLMLWVYINLENKKYAWAALCVALAALIKVYGVGIGLLFLFYPTPIRHGMWAILGILAVAFTPLLVVSWPTFQMFYREWYLIVHESKTLIQLSLMGVLESWFGVTPNAKGLVQILGLLILLFPVFYWKAWREVIYRRLYVSSILIFVVIFNQMAESPTFIIPVAGFILWFLSYKESTPLSRVILVLALLFTMLPATDIYPRVMRHQFLDVYKIKAVPMILAWTLIHWQLLFYPSWRHRLHAASLKNNSDPESRHNAEEVNRDP